MKAKGALSNAVLSSLLLSLLLVTCVDSVWNAMEIAQLAAPVLTSG